MLALTGKLINPSVLTLMSDLISNTIIKELNIIPGNILIISSLLIIIVLELVL